MDAQQQQQQQQQQQSWLRATSWKGTSTSGEQLQRPHARDKTRHRAHDYDDDDDDDDDDDGIDRDSGGNGNGSTSTNCGDDLDLDDDDDNDNDNDGRGRRQRRNADVNTSENVDKKKKKEKTRETRRKKKKRKHREKQQQRDSGDIDTDSISKKKNSGHVESIALRNVADATASKEMADNYHYDFNGDKYMIEFGAADKKEIPMYRESRNCVDTLIQHHYIHGKYSSPGTAMGKNIRVSGQSSDNSTFRYFSKNALKNNRKPRPPTGDVNRVPYHKSHNNTFGVHVEEVMNLFSSNEEDPDNNNYNYNQTDSTEMQYRDRLHRNVQDDPHNVKAWLMLAAYQDVEQGQTGEGIVSSAERKNAAIKKHAILEKALEHNPKEVRLLLELMRTAAVLLFNTTTATKDIQGEEGNTSVMDDYLDDVVNLVPHSALLWRERIFLAKRYHKFTSMNCSHLRIIHYRAIRSLNRFLGDYGNDNGNDNDGNDDDTHTKEKANSDHTRITEHHLIAIFMSLIEIEMMSGQIHFALAKLQSVAEYVLCKEENNCCDADETLSRFESYWDMELPRIGQKSARGWRKELRDHERNISCTHVSHKEDEGMNQSTRKNDSVTPAAIKAGESLKTDDSLTDRECRCEFNKTMTLQNHDEQVSHKQSIAMGDSEESNEDNDAANNSDDSNDDDDDDDDDEEEFDEEAVRKEIGLQLSNVSDSNIPENALSRWIEKEKIAEVDAWNADNFKSRPKIYFDDISDSLIRLNHDDSKLELAIRILEIIGVEVPDDCSVIFELTPPPSNSNKLSEVTSLGDFESMTQRISTSLEPIKKFLSETPKFLEVMDNHSLLFENLSYKNFALNVLQYFYHHACFESKIARTSFLVPQPSLMCKESGQSGNLYHEIREVSKEFLSNISSTYDDVIMLRIWTAHLEIESKRDSIKHVRKIYESMLPAYGNDDFDNAIPILMAAAAEAELYVCADGSILRAVQLCLIACGDKSLKLQSVRTNSANESIYATVQLMQSPETQQFVHSTAMNLIQNTIRTSKIDIRGISILKCAFLFKLVLEGRNAAVDYFQEQLHMFYGDHSTQASICTAIENLVLHQLDTLLVKCTQVQLGLTKSHDLLFSAFQESPSPTPAEERALLKSIWEKLSHNPRLVAIYVSFERINHAQARLQHELSSSLVSSSLEVSISLCFAEVATCGNYGGMQSRHRIRKIFERHLSNHSSPLIWKWYLSFEASSGGRMETAKQIFYRAIRACPWSKTVWMRGLKLLGCSNNNNQSGQAIAGEESSEIIKLARSKGIVFEIDIYEILLEDAIHAGSGK